MKHIDKSNRIIDIVSINDIFYIINIEKGIYV